MVRVLDEKTRYMVDVNEPETGLSLFIQFVRMNPQMSATEPQFEAILALYREFVDGESAETATDG